MKKSTNLLFLLFISIESISQTPIEWYAFNPPIVFDFEDRDANNHFLIDTTQANNIWQVAIPDKIEFNSAFSGDIAMITDSINFYPTNNKSSFILKLFSDDHTELMFNHKFDFDEGVDGGIIELSYDNGNTWINISDTIQYSYEIDSLYISQISSYNNKIGYSGSSNGWKRAWFYFRYSHNGTLFKFTLSSDNIDNQREGWLIDDLQFWILGTPVKEIKRTKIKVFPNPISESIQINIESEITFNIRIIDMKGITILKKDNIYSSNHFCNTSKLEKGIYILEIELGEEIQHFKLIKY
jgi:Secretion system C-terminal sorting domain